MLCFETEGTPIVLTFLQIRIQCLRDEIYLICISLLLIIQRLRRISSHEKTILHAFTRRKLKKPIILWGLVWGGRARVLSFLLNPPPPPPPLLCIVQTMQLIMHLVQHKALQGRVVKTIHRNLHELLRRLLASWLRLLDVLYFLYNKISSLMHPLRWNIKSRTLSTARNELCQHRCAYAVQVVYRQNHYSVLFSLCVQAKCRLYWRCVTAR